MEIQPYKSGRKGLHGPVNAAIYESGCPSGRVYARVETFALDARILQEDAFCHEASGSMKYLLLLNGVIPNISELDDPVRVHRVLSQKAPELCPGATGPIAILLIL